MEVKDEIDQEDVKPVIDEYRWRQVIVDNLVNDFVDAFLIKIGVKPVNVKQEKHYDLLTELISKSEVKAERVWVSGTIFAKDEEDVIACDDNVLDSRSRRPEPVFHGRVGMENNTKRRKLDGPVIETITLNPDDADLDTKNDDQSKPGAKPSVSEEANEPIQSIPLGHLDANQRLPTSDDSLQTLKSTEIPQQNDDSNQVEQSVGDTVDEVTESGVDEPETIRDPITGRHEPVERSPKECAPSIREPDEPEESQPEPPDDPEPDKQPDSPRQESFKCKFCPFTSSILNVVGNHVTDEHADEIKKWMKKKDSKKKRKLTASINP